ncbi:MAG: spore coat protein CotJB [Bacillota bacterium]
MYDEGQMAMLKKLQALEFAAIELTLYLDTHPYDRAALRDYNQLAHELMELKNRYGEKYGPLMAYGFDTAQGDWKWAEEPWPWEIDW